MTNSTRKNINIILPLGLASYVAWTQYQKKTDPKRIAMISGVLLLVSYAIVSSITGAIKKTQDTDLLNNVPNDPTYNPAPLAQAFYQDIYEVFGFRNKQIYYDLAGLTDAQFVSVCRYWNDNFYSKDSETLKQAINGEVLGIELAGTLTNINRRFENLKIN